VLESKARWKLNEGSDSKVIEKLADELKIEPLLAQLLIARGIKNKQDAEAFMKADPTTFYDPFLLAGMKKTVDRIQLALERNEKIRIYGDYDADGVSSTSLMVYLLRQLEADYDYYIPHRANEGYGLNNTALDHAKKNEISLIITVDNGISAYQEVQYAAELGIDVIITDHHEPPEILPEAFSIINPKQPGCAYPFKLLAGVGVAFKLAQALLGRFPEELLQIAAIGTVADLMPLIDENRLIVKLGLEQMRKSSIVGIKALTGIAGIELKEITEMNIGYALAPRINASGRLKHAKDAVQLLIATNEQEAEHLAHQLDQLNKERQQIVDQIATEAMRLNEERMTKYSDSVLVLEQEDWNVGVIGIVASKILDQFYKPVIILSIDPISGLAKGSARSIAGFDLYRALTECKDMLEHYGGHQAAAGMTLHRNKIPEFRAKLNELAKAWLTEEDFIPVTIADMECSIKELPLESIERLEVLAPFGQGNPSPRFIFKQLRIHDLKTIGKDQQHLKLLASQAIGEVSYTMEAIGFGQGNLTRFISPTARIDLIGEISINEWNGVRKPQLRIQDLRITDRQFFDWRGGKKTEWISRLQTGSITSRTNWAPAILLSSVDEQNKFPEEIRNSNCSIWVIKSNGELTALNESAKSTSFSQVKDLLLYSLTPQINRLQSALRQGHSVQRIYALFGNDANKTGTLPSRESFKKVYSALLQLKQWEGYDQRVLQALNKKTGMSIDMIRFIFGVFEELSFIEKTGSSYRFVTSPQKKDLELSLSYQQRLESVEVEQILIYSTTQELNQWIIDLLPKESSIL
jgi:single-stranded-DNA-specific exonuclease